MNKFNRLQDLYIRDPGAFSALPGAMRDHIEKNAPEPIQEKAKVIHLTFSEFRPHEGGHGVRMPLCAPPKSHFGTLATNDLAKVNCHKCRDYISILDNCETYEEALSALAETSLYEDTMKDTNTIKYYGIGEALPEDAFLKLIICDTEESFLINMARFGLIEAPATQPTPEPKADVEVDMTPASNTPADTRPNPGTNKD